MKTILLAAFAALTLMAVAARAESEGAGDPFPFRTAGLVTTTGKPAMATAPASRHLASASPSHQARE